MNPTTTPAETPAPVDAKALNAQFRAQNPAIRLDWREDEDPSECDESHALFCRGIRNAVASAWLFAVSEDADLKPWHWHTCDDIRTHGFPAGWSEGEADDEQTAKDLAELAFWRAITGAQNQQKQAPAVPFDTAKGELPPVDPDDNRYSVEVLSLWKTVNGLEWVVDFFHFSAQEFDIASTSTLWVPLPTLPVAVPTPEGGESDGTE